MRKRFRPSIITLLLTISAIIALATTASAQPGSKTQSGSIRVANLIPDSDSLEIYLQQDTLQPLYLDFHDAGGISYAIPAGPYHVNIAKLGTGIAASMIDSVITLPSDTLTTIVAVGRIANGSRRLALLYTDPTLAPTTGFSYARLFNASPDLGSIDVEMIPSSGDPRKFTSIDFTGVTPYISAAVGDFILKIYRAGASEPFITVYATMPSGQIITAIVTGQQSDISLGVDALFDASPVAQTPLTLLPISLAAVRDLSSSAGGKGSLAAIPNPTADRTMLAYHLEQRSQVTIRIYNALGTLVATMPLGSQPSGDYAAPLALGTLPAGIYQALLDGDHAPIASTRITVIR